LSASGLANDWPRQLRGKLPARLHSRVWLVRLNDWLAAWPQISVANFCRSLVDVDRCEPAVGEGRWVVAVLPEAGWAERAGDARAGPLLLASSRLGSWSERSDLAQAVRHWLTQLSSANGDLVTGQGMTCQSLSIHAAHAYGLACWEWLPSEHRNWHRWFEQVVRSCQEPARGMRHARLFVTPALEEVPEQAPVADRLAFASARQVFILSLRGGGHTWDLARESLAQEATVGRVQVYLPPRCAAEPKSVSQHREAAQQLMAAGAVGWHGATPPEFHTDSPARIVANTTRTAVGVPPAERVQRLEPGTSTAFLCHHTRGNPQQWPEEVEGDFWWRWLTDGANLCWPWETLLRIACQQKLRAGRRLIPGQQPVVCFSGRCPVETAALRTFRAHLRRWDYEPYGVAIQKAWLEQHGVRAVEYLDSGQPTHHFQQIRYSKGSEVSRIDWALEQEYRWEGDLDLRTVPTNAMFYFVRTAIEAQQLAGYTACQVKYLDHEV
jgi:hypothetical protein